MVRGFISGVFWGLVFTVLSLWIVTQLSDVVRLLVAPNQITQIAPDGAGLTPDLGGETANAPNPLGQDLPQLAQEGTALDVAAPDAAPSPDVSTAAAPQVAARPAANVETPQTRTSDATPAADPQPEPPRTDAATTEQPEAPGAESAPQVDIKPAAAAQEVAPSPEAGDVLAPDTDNEADLVADAALPEAGTVADDEAQLDAGAATSAEVVDFSAPQVVELGQEAQAALDQAETEAVAQASEDQGDPETLPETGPKSSVTVNRLPTIGGDATENDPAPETQSDPDLVEWDENTPALIRNARPFENPEGLPLMAIVLLTGTKGEVARSQSELPVAVSYALDASLENAGELMEKVRAAGQEVLAIAPLIDRAQPSDVEVAFADYLARVPQAVAVMDLPDGRFQADRNVAAQVIAHLAASGHGMVTYKRGFNAGLQMAERDGLPAAMVFRDFDGAGQDRAAIKRFLDQAAFRAGQQSGVVMVGRDTPETLAAILEWSLGTRANTVKLAPISAILQNETGG